MSKKRKTASFFKKIHSSNHVRKLNRSFVLNIHYVINSLNLKYHKKELKKSRKWQISLSEQFSTMSPLFSSFSAIFCEKCFLWDLKPLAAYTIYFIILFLSILFTSRLCLSLMTFTYEWEHFLFHSHGSEEMRGLRRN